MPVSPGSHGSRYSAAWTPRAVSGVSRPVAGSTTSMAMLSQAMRPPSRSVMLSRTIAPVERRQDRLGDLEQLALAADLAFERGALLAQPLGRVGVGHRLGREAGVDHEQPQVVVGELVEAELREDEDAEDLVLEEHRREQHRLVEVVLGARDGVGPRVLRGVAAGSGRRRARRPSR